MVGLDSFTNSSEQFAVPLCSVQAVRSPSVGPLDTLIRAKIRVYHDAGNVIKTQEHKGDFEEP